MTMEIWKDIRTQDMSGNMPHKISVLEKTPN